MYYLITVYRQVHKRHLAARAEAEAERRAGRPEDASGIEP